MVRKYKESTSKMWANVMTSFQSLRITNTYVCVCVNDRSLIKKSCLLLASQSMWDGHTHTHTHRIAALQCPDVSPCEGASDGAAGLQHVPVSDPESFTSGSRKSFIINLCSYSSTCEPAACFHQHAASTFTSGSLPSTTSLHLCFLSRTWTWACFFFSLSSLKALAEAGNH